MYLLPISLSQSVFLPLGVDVCVLTLLVGLYKYLPLLVRPMIVYPD